MMTGEEFKTIRKRLGFTQTQLGHLLGYVDHIAISGFERKALRRPVPFQTGLLMEALAGGFWSAGWPAREVIDGRGKDATAEAKGSSRLPRDQHGHAGEPAEGRGDPVRRHRARARAVDASVRPGRP